MQTPTWIRLLSPILFLSYTSFGQSVNAYGFFAPGQLRLEGDSTTALHTGGGFKYISSSGLGLGAEVGIAGPSEGFGASYVGLFSPNAYFVFSPDRDARVQPFFTGGYTRTFSRQARDNMGNFGRGLTYWASERAGILVEYRHHVGRSDGSTLQLWTIRLGIAFR